MVRSIIVNSKDDIFAAVRDSGVFRSTDNGDSWIRANNGLTTTYAVSFGVNSDEQIFAGTVGGGIYRSANNGDSWIQINNGITNFYIESFAVNSNDDVLAGSRYGVFLSIDNGENWTSLNSGLKNSSVQSLVVDQDNYIFAGTYAVGVFRSSNSTVLVKKQELIPKEFSLEQNYPNPFNPLTKIQYTISSNQFVILKVYNILGREVSTLVNKEQQTGSYEVVFNASNLTSGVYIYTIKAGSFYQTKKLVLLI